jgi:hypothetical protein
MLGKQQADLIKTNLSKRDAARLEKLVDQYEGCLAVPPDTLEEIQDLIKQAMIWENS